MYKEWKESLAKHHDINYYHNMLKYADHILNDIGRSSQKQVAEALQLKPGSFSILKPLLIAYTEREQ